MRRVVRSLLIFAFSCNMVFAANYKVLVIPDNLSSKHAVDSFVYEDSSEYFATQVINKLNLSSTIEAPSVSEVREKLARNPRLNIATRDALLRFKNGYNINYMNLKKLALMFNTNKILLITTTADAQNYFIRRTFWDFLNIPGASVIDPAIKLSTYAVLVDTDRDVTVWEDTFYKTISNCEARMVANQLGPQTQQLEKIRDYSKMLGPQIAHYVQASIVPASMLTRGNTIQYGPRDFENVLTKKYKWYKHGTKDMIREADERYTDHLELQRARGVEPLSDKCRRKKTEFKNKKEELQQQWAEERRLRQELKQQQADEQSRIRQQENHIQDISNTKPEEKTVEPNQVQQQTPIKNAVEQKPVKEKTKPVTVQPQDKNVVEIKDVKQLDQQGSKKKIRKHKEEPKLLNVSKDEHIQPVFDTLPEPKLKYHQAKPHSMPEVKNTTINDI